MRRRKAQGKHSRCIRWSSTQSHLLPHHRKRPKKKTRTCQKRWQAQVWLLSHIIPSIILTSLTAITIESTHPPTLLQDYGGPIFHHHRAFLHQLDIHDSANNLITPDRWYSELCQDTLVLFAATMHGYVQKEHGQKSRKVQRLAYSICCSNRA